MNVFLALSSNVTAGMVVEIQTVRFASISEIKNQEDGFI